MHHVRHALHVGLSLRIHRNWIGVDFLSYYVQIGVGLLCRYCLSRWISAGNVLDHTGYFAVIGCMIWTDCIVTSSLVLVEISVRKLSVVSIDVVLDTNFIY